MQLIKIADAYQAVCQMRSVEYYNGKELVRTERELPFAQAAALVELSGKLKPHCEYFSAEENKLTQEYAKKDENGNPMITGSSVSFETTENKAAFDSGCGKLGALEREIEGLPVTMSKPTTVRCSWLEALDGLVEFV